MRVTRTFFAGFIFLIFNHLNAQTAFPAGSYQVDETLRMIVCNRLPGSVPGGTASLSFDKTYTLSTPVSGFQTGIPYEASANGQTYQVYFSRLPLLALRAGDYINDTESRGYLTLADTLGDAYQSDIGIKIHGSYSSTLPKKSYRVQLWVDSTGTTTKDESLFGLRSDKRWLLLAMYNEKLRLNNKVSEDLWLRVHKLYYADQEPDAHSTIRTRYVEVFLNNKYQGVYLFTENTDRKQLKLKKQTTAGTGGELYKGDTQDAGTDFTGVPALYNQASAVWGGWELSYPDATDWVNLQNLTRFVVTSPDSTFRNELPTRLREDNLIDYFLFLNLTRAEDNTGKNTFFARYDETSPYFMAPWDLDGTWGYWWNGDRRPVTDDILSNGLFDRLLKTTGNFRIKAAQRWFSLRENALSSDSLNANILRQHAFLRQNGVYERERKVWAGDLLSYDSTEVDYALNWLRARTNFLDSYFRQLTAGDAVIYQFSAALHESAVAVTWSANCAAIASFDLQRSTDSTTWTTLKTYSSADSCSYAYTDETVPDGTSYYRLRFTDGQGQTAYSSVQTIVRATAVTGVRVYPNPASDLLQISGKVQAFSVLSPVGTAVYRGDGSLPRTINVRQLPAGLYLVRVEDKDGLITTHKVLIHR